MSSALELHAQIASIVEVLANSAVAEICKAVEDGYAVVNLEMSRSLKENECLRRRLRLLELQVSRYRAEQRLKPPPEGAASSRVFPGVRLHRSGRDTPSGLLSRSRSLNRSSLSQPQLKTPAPVLDQDPDQDVVTTTKTEPAEPEEDSDLVIVKVEGSVSVDSPSISHASPAPPAPAFDSQPQTRSQTEGQEPQEYPGSFWKSEVEKEEDNFQTSPPNVEQSSFIPNWQGHYQNQEQRPNSTYQLKHFPTILDLDSSQASTSTSFLHQGSQEVYASSQNISNPCFRQENFKPAILSVENKTNKALLGEGNQIASSQDQPVLPRLSKQPKLLYYSCRICNRTFAQKGRLLSHEKAHRAETPQKCDQCGLVFDHFCQLKIHKEMHTGAKPHRCPQCGKHFSTAGNLKIHQNVHSGERKFKCNMCDKSYIFRSNLNRHKAVHEQQ